MCHLEYYVYNNCAHKQDPQYFRPRRITNRLRFIFRDKLDNEPGWVPCPHVLNWPGPGITPEACKLAYGGLWQVQEFIHPDGGNCVICNRSSEYNNHYIAIQAGVIIAARAIPDRLHRSNDRYAGGPGRPSMCPECTAAANNQAPPPPPVSTIQSKTQTSGPSQIIPNIWRPMNHPRSWLKRPMRFRFCVVRKKDRKQNKLLERLLIVPINFWYFKLNPDIQTLGHWH